MDYKRRNQEILTLLESGLNLQQVADRYGITRARVFTICQKLHFNYSKIVENRLRTKRQEVEQLRLQKEKKENEIRFNCLVCQKPVKHKDSNNKYFCKDCRNKGYSTVIHTCVICGKKYYAKYISLKSVKHYCSRDCYHNRKLAVDKAK